MGSGTTGTLENKDIRTAASGKEWGKAWLGGKEYLVFGRTVAFLRPIATGSEVEFTAKSNENGPGMVLTSIRATGSTAPTNASPKPNVAVSEGFKGAPKSEFTPLSMLYSYAKDLVVAGVIPTPVKTPAAVADVIATTAYELKTKLNQAQAPADAPVKADPTPAATRQ